VPLVVSFVAAAALAGAGLAAILADRGEGTATPTRSTPRTTTHQSAQPPPPPPARDGVALTDQATRLLQAGDYSGAERIAQEAVAALHGSGQTYEAYAEYDLGQALAQLGRCDEALPHLDRSQQLQGHHKEIDEARRGCEKGKKKKGHRVR
jgi:hypothetical protein